MGKRNKLEITYTLPRFFLPFQNLVSIKIQIIKHIWSTYDAQKKLYTFNLKTRHMSIEEWMDILLCNYNLKKKFCQMWWDRKIKHTYWLSRFHMIMITVTRTWKNHHDLQQIVIHFVSATTEKNIYCEVEKKKWYDLLFGYFHKL